ncbi:MAG: glycosyltransferase family 4 protein [Kiritimatiellales bacterium]
MKSRILAIIHLPPPMHGQSLINSFVAESDLLKLHFDMQVVPIRFVLKLNEIGRFAVRKIWLSIKLLAAIGYQLVRHRPNLVYMTPCVTGWAFYRELLIIGFVKLFRLKILLHLHNRGIREAAANPVKRMLYRMFFFHTNVICSSSRLTCDVERVYKGQPYIVPNGIKAVENSIVTDAQDRECDVVRFLYLSNITKGKGIVEFLDALQLLKQNEGIDFKAHIVGQPNDVSAAELTELIAAKGLDGSVIYRGGLSNEDKNLELDWADVFVFPTKIDVFPLVLLEAMQHRLPVISTDMLAIPDIVKDGETGLLVGLGSVPDIVEKMKRLASDPDLRRVMGQKGFEHYEAKFTVEAYERGLKKVFENVLTQA